MKRLGTPLRLLATDAMFRITPLRPATKPGTDACMVRNIERTFRSNASAQSSSFASCSVPWCTMPAQLNRMSIAPASRAACLMSSPRSTSSRAVRMVSEAIACSFAASMSVAITRAPAAAKASAVARPMPWPAAGVKAVLLASGPGMAPRIRRFPRQRKAAPLCACLAHFLLDRAQQPGREVLRYALRNEHDARRVVVRWPAFEKFGRGGHVLHAMDHRRLAGHLRDVHQPLQPQQSCTAVLRHGLKQQRQRERGNRTVALQREGLDAVAVLRLGERIAGRGVG